MSQGKNWCFTLFQYEQVPVWNELPDWATYMVFQEEQAPDTGRKHIQGYVQLVTQKRMKALKTLMNSDSAHLSIAKGTAKQNKVYCTKEDTRVSGPWEYGEIIERGSNKRKVMEKYKEDPENMKLEDPKTYRRCFAKEVNEQFKALELPNMDRPWQVILDHMLGFGPDDRHIYWVYGSRGNEGKTTWAKVKVQKEGWHYSRGGKGQDIKYGYIEHLGNIIFDIPRQSEDCLQYSVVEEIKDRMLCSIKYEPIEVYSNKPVHVVVLANFKPVMQETYTADGRSLKRQMLSKDRLILINIDDMEVETEDSRRSFTDILEEIQDPEASSPTDTVVPETQETSPRPIIDPVEVDIDVNNNIINDVLLEAQETGAANRIRARYNKGPNYIV